MSDISKQPNCNNCGCYTRIEYLERNVESLWKKINTATYLLISNLVMVVVLLILNIINK